MLHPSHAKVQDLAQIAQFEISEAVDVVSSRRHIAPVNHDGHIIFHGDIAAIELDQAAAAIKRRAALNSDERWLSS